MLIGKKLNLLIIGVIAAIFIAITLVVLMYIPVLGMNDEKSSLLSLDAAIVELRADVNKLQINTYNEQIGVIREKHDLLLGEFEKLENLTHLKKDEEIDEALRVISRLYTLYEVNYVRLMELSQPLEDYFKDIFLSANIKIIEIADSTLLKRHEDRYDVESMLSSLSSTVSIIDSNLISTHSVVVEQFGLIDKLIESRQRRVFITAALVLFAVGIASFFAAFIIASRITRNIRKAAEGIERMSSGDISEEFNIESRDEIEELGENLNTLTDSLKTVFNMMKANSNKGVALKEELIASANQTSAAAAQIAANSQGISEKFMMLSTRVGSADEANLKMKESLGSLDRWVQEQSAMVEESTSAVTEMISSINNVNEITRRKRAATDGLVKTADTGGSKLQATIRVVNEINESLDQIKGAATIIQQIASQTNLLAMNAAIEAAHAGDAGRGFAVVADEIRKLAEASSVNSKQINGVIKEVVSRIEIASASGVETEAAFSEIDREVEGVARSLDEIGSSMEELNIGGKQILEAMTGLQDVSVHVNQGSRDMEDASSKVTDAIDVVSRITSEVSGSAGEITIGITEVSGAMSLVTELSGDLGEITDSLEREASCYTTERSEAACVESDMTDSDEDDSETIEGSDVTAVTISDEEDRADLSIEPIEASKE